MFQRMLCGVAALLLCGCTTERPDPYIMDASQCMRYGFEQGTPAFAQCLMQLGMARQQRQQAALGMLLGMQRPIYQLAAPPSLQRSNPIMNCTSLVNGQIISTNCH